MDTFKCAIIWFKMEGTLHNVTAFASEFKLQYQLAEINNIYLI